MLETTASSLPHGWRIDRSEHTNSFDDERRVKFAIYDGEATWESGEPRPALEVGLTLGGKRFGRPADPEVSWPATSDRRPALAQALAVALLMAAEEAQA